MLNLLFIFIIGLCIGSFLSVVIYRLPIILEKKWRYHCSQYLQLPQKNSQTRPFNLFFPASHCPHCQTALRIIHNIPLLSFTLQRGNCAHCKQKISWRYPGVEFLTACITVILFWQYGFTVTEGFVLSSIFSYGLISLAFIDLNDQLLPDEITLGLMWLGLLANLYHIFTSIEAAMAGAMVGYLTLWSINFIFKQITQKEGMGQGDFKLAAALGAWCGIGFLLFIFLFATFLGLLMSLFRISWKYQARNTPIPFGPYLAIAGFIALQAGYLLKQWLPFVVPIPQ